MSWRPRLRADVTLEEGGLRDATLDRLIPAGRLTRGLATRLDGARDLPHLLDEVAAETGEPVGEVEAALRALLLLSLVEGAGEETVAALRRVEQAPVPAPRLLPGARFGCLGSGQCCRVYRPGPLSDDDLARLDAAGDALQAAGLPPPPWHEERVGEDGTPGRYLRRAEDGGRCLFLLADGRCGVHAGAGPEAKPDPCRLFPFDAVRTVDDLRLFDVATCSALGRTTARGPTHAEHARELAPLLPRRPRLFHPQVLLEAGLPCDYGHLLPLEERLRHAIATGPLAAGLTRAVAHARAFVTAAGDLPLEQAQPQRRLAEVLAAEPPALEPDPSAAVWALARVTEALERAARVEEARAAPLAGEVAHACAALRSRIAARAGLADGPLPEALVQAEALPLDRGAADALLRASLLRRLFGHRLLVRGHLRAGLLRLCLLALLTPTGARLAAQGRGGARVAVEDLDLGHWLAALALTRPALEAALVQVEDACWAVAAATPGWLERA